MIQGGGGGGSALMGTPARSNWRHSSTWRWRLDHKTQTTDRPPPGIFFLFFSCWMFSSSRYGQLSSTKHSLNASFQLRVIKSKYIVWSDIFSINLKSHRAIYNKSANAIIISSDLSPWAVASSVSIIGVLVFNAFSLLKGKLIASLRSTSHFVLLQIESTSSSTFIWISFFFVYLDFSPILPASQKVLFQGRQPERRQTRKRDGRKRDR